MSVGRQYPSCSGSTNVPGRRGSRILRTLSQTSLTALAVRYSLPALTSTVRRRDLGVAIDPGEHLGSRPFLMEVAYVSPHARGCVARSRNRLGDRQGARDGGGAAHSRRSLRRSPVV